MAVYTTIDDPEAYFQVKTYTGNGTAIGSGGQAVTLDGSTNLSPNLVWIKQRGTTTHHNLYDTVRPNPNTLYPNLSNTADATNTESLTVFGSDGFTVGNEGDVNTSSGTYVAWCWKESATAGFDIVSYTGNGSARTISHSLSAVPHLMILKSRSYAENWQIYNHKMASDPETDFLEFRNTAIADSAGTWNDTAPISSVFSVGDRDATNKNTYTYINYLWTEKQGFSKFGVYEGNGHADGTFVNTGFRPAWLMVKKTNSATNNEWIIWDNKRSTFNMVQKKLAAHLNNAETDASWVGIDFSSNGFTCKSNDSIFNGYGDTYIYMAFGEAPFVNSKGVPCNAR